MAVVHRAELAPSKLELLAAWLPSQPWFVDAGPIDRVTTFRLDDPAGEVGVETFIVSSGGALFHVPMTYRSSPLDGGVLIGETEHSVLGHRFVYDGPSDPVYVAVTTEAIVTGGHEVDMFFADGTPIPRLEWMGSVVGTGEGQDLSGAQLRVCRAIPREVPVGTARLDATWEGQTGPVAVAWLGRESVVAA